VEELSQEAVMRFIYDLPRHIAALQGWRPRDNSMTLACLDELLRKVAMGEPAPENLDAESLGDIVSARTDALLG
jgi:hypothetical protein